ncbi:secreted protein [Beggiatoa sp. PS]|nr:secreted protein [Beggiatoa sp. PS]
MKRLRCWFVSTVFLIPLFWGTTAIAQTDLLNLDSYAEGTQVPYGENMVVVQDEETGEKWITPLKETNGRLNIPINLPSESFEIILEVHGIREGETDGFFLIADEVQFEFNLSKPYSSINAHTDIEGSREKAPVWQNDAKNIARFIVNGGVAKVYVNDVFVQKVTISEEKQNITYTNLMVTNIDDDYILYSLKIQGASDVGVPTDPSSIPTTPSVSGDCMATYSLTGQVHIPCISVPDAFGGTTVYDVNMQQQPGGFTFDLDLNSVKPR